MWRNYEKTASVVLAVIVSFLDKAGQLSSSEACKELDGKLKKVISQRSLF